ncbi:MAG: type II toxin-antitoxin system VapC family toxin [Nitrospirae bacterium]|nr:type II toxin-antitoxin system VapC family toxin [Nitrospirota bacterium]
MKLLLDTHVLVWWWIDDSALPPAFANAIDGSAKRGEPIGISAFSLWEVAMLASRGRLIFTGSADAFLEEVENDPAVQILPLTARIAMESTRLGPTFPTDPADQIIAATARCHGLRLLTADERIRRSGVVALA